MLLADLTDAWGIKWLELANDPDRITHFPDEVAQTVAGASEVASPKAH
jgi:hypothetical protein